MRRSWTLAFDSEAKRSHEILGNLGVKAPSCKAKACRDFYSSRQSSSESRGSPRCCFRVPQTSVPEHMSVWRRTAHDTFRRAKPEAACEPAASKHSTRLGKGTYQHVFEALVHGGNRRARGKGEREDEGREVKGKGKKNHERKWEKGTFSGKRKLYCRSHRGTQDFESMVFMTECGSRERVCVKSEE